MLSSWVMVLKLSRKVHFFEIFCWPQQKNKSVKAIYLYAPESSHYTLSENGMVYGGLEYQKRCWLSRNITNLCYLKDILRMRFPSNWFPSNTSNNCIQTFLNENILHTFVAMFIALPYLGNLFLSIRTRLQNSVKKIFLFVRLTLFLRPQHVLVLFFRFEDKVPINLRPNVVYKFSCGRCNATY